ncbi:DUF4159 domain-containing protein [Celeribacter sp.]|uniref:DUF4159 domain-containing protein n=1 Tax=Celeribacter sp. TaxID=1890673 RepID=UPI003A8DDDBD
MLILGPIGFTLPWVLVALLALPLLWWLLRAVPPAPLRRRFPGVALLLGLDDEEVETDRTPWWLLLLRMLAVAALIVAFAGPVLNPRVERGGAGALVILLDGSWASAQDWSLRMGRVEAALDQAQVDERVVTIVVASDPPAAAPEFRAPRAWRPSLAGLSPAPFAPDYAATSDALGAIEEGFDTLWLSDGLEREGRAELLALLDDKGQATVFENPRAILALGPADVTEAGVEVTALRQSATAPQDVTLIARGPDPAGIERDLARVEAGFDAGETAVTVTLDMPPEIRNRVTRFEIDGQRSAAALRLTDDSLKRREIGLVTTRESREGLELLSQLHYIRAAFEGKADLISGALDDLIAANPDVIVLADVAQLSGGEAAGLLDWMSEGGVLMRFAGPRLAASDVSRAYEDPLMPVRLRAGGRTIGGAMSWGEPKALRPFSETSPFYGLTVPEDVTVSAQVLAQPDPDLAARVIATLADGTPLVTRKPVGEGQVVLFHVTANAEWSTLPLSGLFVSMLDRLALASGRVAMEADDLAGQVLQPLRLLDGFGAFHDAGSRAPIDGADFVTARASRETPPGLYQGTDATMALNVIGEGDTLAPAIWPAGTEIVGATQRAERPLMPHFLLAALALLAVDLLAALALSGRLRGPRSIASAILIAFLAVPPSGARAQETDTAFALAATDEVALAHVLTGDAALDDLARAGAFGLSRILAQRTSVEPVAPVGVDLEADELGFFPLLYWPVSVDQPTPSAEAYTRLNAYLRTGGTILFDTRDADISGFGRTTPTGVKLQELAAPLDIPPLEPIPADHVLTRTFYLLQDFPGRHTGGELWVEAAPADAQNVEGMPFRNLNDNVTPVIIGGNDWASAWAMDAYGNAMRPVGRGFNGERQREIAYRFGVNLMMYVLTGNYKSDQVHVPALLDRLGQ